MAGAHEIDAWLKSLSEDERNKQILRIHRKHEEKVIRSENIEAEELKKIIEDLNLWFQRKFGKTERTINQ